MAPETAGIKINPGCDGRFEHLSLYSIKSTFFRDSLAEGEVAF